MPYIKQEDRDKVFSGFGPSIRQHNIETAGELQYAIAVMLKGYIERKGLNYQHCNDVMGALAGAQMEFYRRTVVPYEDKKITENGDV
jgi:hypothetical protein